MRFLAEEASRDTYVRLMDIPPLLPSRRGGRRSAADPPGRRSARPSTRRAGTGSTGSTRGDSRHSMSSTSTRARGCGSSMFHEEIHARTMSDLLRSSCLQRIARSSLGGEHSKDERIGPVPPLLLVVGDEGDERLLLDRRERGHPGRRVGVANRAAGEHRGALLGEESQALPIAGRECAFARERDRQHSAAALVSQRHSEPAPGAGGTQGLRHPREPPGQLRSIEPQLGAGAEHLRLGGRSIAPHSRARRRDFRRDPGARRDLELPVVRLPGNHEPDRAETIEAMCGERCDDVLFRLAVDERGPEALGGLGIVRRVDRDDRLCLRARPREPLALVEAGSVADEALAPALPHLARGARLLGRVRALPLEREEASARERVRAHGRHLGDEGARRSVEALHLVEGEREDPAGWSSATRGRKAQAARSGSPLNASSGTFG